MISLEINSDLILEIWCIYYFRESLFLRFLVFTLNIDFFFWPQESLKYDGINIF